MARDLAQRARQSVEQQQANGKDLRQQLMRMEAQFQRAMPRGSEAVQLIRDVMTCMSQTPKLALCDAPSVLGAAMTCAQLGLRPGVGALGQAWILPFWDGKSGGQRAQLIIGYKGYIELGHRSDRIASLHSRIVYANDHFTVKYGAAEDVWEHEPCLDGERGDARLFYAVGRLANGGYSLTDPMTVADMQKHRDRFAMARKNGKVVGPWVDHFESMAQKTMLLRLMALMPKSTDIQRAMDNDGAIRMDLSESAIDTPTHIDGEVIGDPIDEPVDAPPEERESIHVSGPDDTEAPNGVGEERITRAQSTKLHTLLTAEGLGGNTKEQRAAKLDWLSSAVSRPISSSDDLTRTEASDVIDLLENAQTPAEPAQAQ
jgi:recombination protein RecT